MRLADGNGLGYDAGEALGEALARNTTLRWLDLGSNPLLDRGVDSLLRGLQFNRRSSLNSLLLANCSLQAAGAPARVWHVANALPAVVNLDLRFNSEISAAEREALHRANAARERAGDGRAPMQLTLDQVRVVETLTMPLLVPLD
jgi:hypothetical protein